MLKELAVKGNESELAVTVQRFPDLSINVLFPFRN